MISLFVEYKIKDGLSRESFYDSLLEKRVIDKTLAEPGCSNYCFFYPAAGENSLFLLESWKDEAAQAAHKKTDQFGILQILKEVFVASVHLHNEIFL